MFDSKRIPLAFSCSATGRNGSATEALEKKMLRPLGSEPSEDILGMEQPGVLCFQEPGDAKIASEREDTLLSNVHTYQSP